MIQENLTIAASLLSNTAFFAEVDPVFLNTFSAELDLVHLYAGEVLMREGDPGDAMYIVITGRLHVFVQTPQETEKLVGEIAGGMFVGEMALMTEEPRSGTVRAVRDTELVKVTRVVFEHIITRYPRVVLKISASIIEQVRRLSRGHIDVSPFKTIAVIPVGREVPLTLFTERLSKALRARGAVLHLNKKRFEEVHRTNVAAQEIGTEVDSRTIAAWMSYQETVNRFILYEADDTDSAWTRRCIREADRLVLVGRARDSFAEGGGAQALAGLLEQGNRRSAAKELVLLHEDKQQRPYGTHRWLAGNEVVRHTHISLDQPKDFGRLARLLAGEAVGLVLGGGGARGFAHLGILRALEEASIPVDLICGVSMGAILAAQYAMGLDVASMLRKTKKGLVETRLGDFTLPLVSISSGKTFRKVLRGFYGDTNIEDVWLNYFCISCNISTAETVVHREGPLWRAVSASNAIPGIMPPVPDDGSLLVDGGIVNNQPGDILKQSCGGPIIVVNVSPQKELTVDAAFEALPSPWRLLWHRLSPFHETISVPNISAMMMRTLMVSSLRKMQEVEEQADYYLRPPLNQFKLDDYARIDEIVETGYDYAKAQIATWNPLPG